MRVSKGLLLAIFAALSLSCRAHAPYEVPHGTFKRSDGVEVRIATHFVDGILFADSGSVVFRLPDNSIITNTTTTRNDLVVRRRTTNVEVWHFPSDWLPVASEVETFDGYTLSDSAKLFLVAMSPLIHISGHTMEYAIATAVWLSFCLAIVALRRSASKLPPAVVVALTGALSLLLLLVSSASPVVIGIAIAVLTVIYRRCGTRRKRATTETIRESSSPPPRV